MADIGAFEGNVMEANFKSAIIGKFPNLHYPFIY